MYIYSDTYCRRGEREIEREREGERERGREGERERDRGRDMYISIIINTYIYI